MLNSSDSPSSQKKMKTYKISRFLIHCQLDDGYSFIIISLYCLAGLLELFSMGINDYKVALREDNLSHEMYSISINTTQKRTSKRWQHHDETDTISVAHSASTMDKRRGFYRLSQTITTTTTKLNLKTLPVYLQLAFHKSHISSLWKDSELINNSSTSDLNRTIFIIED